MRQIVVQKKKIYLRVSISASESLDFPPVFGLLFKCRVDILVVGGLIFGSTVERFVIVGWLSPIVFLVGDFEPFSTSAL